MIERRILPRRLLLAAAVSAAVAPTVFAEDAELRIPVVLEAGNRARSFEGAISDFEVVSYVVALRKGQSLRVVLATNNSSNCFDIHAPDKAKPVHVGSESGSSVQWVAQAAGDYLVKVFLLRLAARDGQTAQYTLELEVSG